MKQNKYAMKFGHKHVRIVLMTAVGIFLLFASADSTRGVSSLTSVLRHADKPQSVASVASQSPSDDQNYIQRGDWETPDILLLVENEEWQNSIEVIVAASLQDRIPPYILTNRYDGEEPSVEQLRKEWRRRHLRVFYDTPWIRDYGPLQIKTTGNSVQWMDFGYAQDRPRDDSVPQQLAEYMELPIEYGDYYLEGGSVISNGRGLCAITDVSVEKAQVDPSSPEDIASFRKILGCSALAILPALTGESTSHADIIAQFLSAETVAVSSVTPDVSYEVSFELDEAVEKILSAARSIGQNLRIIRVPMYVDGPDFYSYVNGTRLRNSYLLPSFENVPPEIQKAAYHAVTSALKGARLVPVPADSMALNGGAVHCITLGLSLPRPAGTLQHRVQGKGIDFFYSRLVVKRAHSSRNLNK
ncbi:MAG: hypothetical protein AMK71_02905 [Nitrospira bacterium SG8_35_4]|nr:MAG: hypothetical protein AMK71_02905 [Nitrospira bacterium SG8_35_4]